MTASITGTLDTDSRLATSSPLSLTTETVVTLYVFEKTGTSKKHQVVLQFSPDGTNWITHPIAVRGEGKVTATVASDEVRACVSEDEGGTSTIDFHIVAN